MKNSSFFLLIFHLSFGLSAQKASLVNEKFDQYPEIVDCKNHSSYQEAKECISLKINQHVQKNISYNSLNKIVNASFKNILPEDEWQELKGTGMALDFKVSVILSYDKKWRVKNIETQFPKTETYLEAFFESLPAIKKAGVYDGKLINLVYHVPFKVFVVFY
ncbi:hypothetical protein [Psychroflexus maritimus]|uniref:TonB protein C-terminal n=1 Tax=Psychroflexus maritimus TaxID=2714865 RepID=A0A967AH79_9FLAO|nr:hypothetical protein [Psychroflexus maritimus]NGZ90421.1 hypothetical protein [Psychroflexus maritimus]